MSAEELARLFHDAYERLAPSFGYETRKESAVAWEQVPEQNRSLMIAVAGEVLTRLEQPVGYWHAYRAEDLPALIAELGPSMAFTVVEDQRKEAVPVYRGALFGEEIAFNYVTTWDHRPSDAEKEKVQLAAWLENGEGEK
jgi:hypothetical protein